MPISFGPTIVEGKVYRGKKKNDDDEEKQAFAELQLILNSKNRKACDCEAQVHELLENCLNCGRLTCESEGPGKCFSCGSIVVSQGQREKLKKHIDIMQSFPATSSHKASAGTKIVDTQFDYFTIDSSKHLRREERRKIRENLDELQSKKYKRNMVLDIDVDNLEVTSRSVPEIPDYEDRLRDLQIHCQPVESGYNLALAELVQMESKTSYDLEYINHHDFKKKKPASTSKPVDPNLKDETHPKADRQKPTSQQENQKSKYTNQNKSKKKQNSAWVNKSNKNNE